MVIAHPVANKQKSVDICNAFIAGAPSSAKGHVFYGVNESNWKTWLAAQREDWFYIDNSFFDVVRGQQFRIARCRVQTLIGERTSDGTRFDALGLTIAPWKPIGPHWLAVQQSPSFMLCVANSPRWLEQTAGAIPKGAVVKVRRWAGDKLKQQATLPADLAWADVVLTHSSAAAVQAALAGVNIVVSPMSALGGMICARDDMAERDERRRYLSVLADNQFSLLEIREGKAWAWLTSNQR